MISGLSRGWRPLHLEYRLDGGVAVVKVIGDLDVFTSGEFREGLLRVISDESERSLVVNLAGVSFIDSTGTGVLVGCGTGPRDEWHAGRGRPVSPGPRHPGDDRPGPHVPGLSGRGGGRARLPRGCRRVAHQRRPGASRPGTSPAALAPRTAS